MSHNNTQSYSYQHLQTFTNNYKHLALHNYLITYKPYKYNNTISMQLSHITYVMKIMKSTW